MKNQMDNMMANIKLYLLKLLKILNIPLFDLFIIINTNFVVKMASSFKSVIKKKKIDAVKSFKGVYTLNHNFYQQQNVSMTLANKLLKLSNHVIVQIEIPKEIINNII